MRGLVKTIAPTVRGICTKVNTENINTCIRAAISVVDVGCGGKERERERQRERERERERGIERERERVFCKLKCNDAQARIAVSLARVLPSLAEPCRGAAYRRQAPRAEKGPLD